MSTNAVRVPEDADEERSPASILRDMARDALMKSGWGNREKAHVAVSRKLRGNAELMEGLLHPIIDEALNQAVRSATTAERRASVSDASSLDRERLTLRGMADAALGMLRFPLPSTGRPLGEALRSEVITASAFYAAHRRGHEVNERWLRLVADAAKDEKKPIRLQVREEDVADMRTRAAKETK